MRFDLLADALSKITNGIRMGRDEVVVRPTSKLLNNVLTIFKNEGFIEDFKYEDDNRGGYITVQLNGRMNKCMAVKPRFPAKEDEIEKYEKRYLPAKGFGCLIISTPKGLMTHVEAEEANQGGKLIAFVY